MEMIMTGKTERKEKIMKLEKGIDAIEVLPLTLKMSWDISYLLMQVKKSLCQNPFKISISLIVRAALLVINFFQKM